MNASAARGMWPVTRQSRAMLLETAGDEAVGVLFPGVSRLLLEVDSLPKKCYGDQRHGCRERGARRWPEAG